MPPIDTLGINMPFGWELKERRVTECDRYGSGCVSVCQCVGGWEGVEKAI